MQEITNAAWYAGNEILKYPIDSDATGWSDENEPLPTSLISDIRIVSARQKDFFISGVTCSKYLISVVIASRSGIEAAITIPKTYLKPLNHYLLESFNDDTCGVIAFGHADVYGQWKFSSPEQSRLAPTCVCTLKPWPVSAITVDQALKGDVLFSAGIGTEVSVETVRLGNTREDGAIGSKNYVEQRAIVFRMSADYEQHKDYFGCCTYRPDNEDCYYITSLAGIEPDEHGNIAIVVNNEKPDTYELVEVESYDEPVDAIVCKAQYTKSTICINVKDKPKDDLMTFGLCGEDVCVCDEDEEDIDTTKKAKQTEISLARSLNMDPFTAVDLKNDVYPLTEVGIAYYYNTGLFSELDNETAIGFTDATGRHVIATFKYDLNYECGVLFQINGHMSYKKLSYDGSILSLGEKSQEVTVESPSVSLEIFLENNILTCNLYDGSLIVATITSTEPTLGRLGISMKNCQCLNWRIR